MWIAVVNRYEERAKKWGWTTPRGNWSDSASLPQVMVCVFFEVFLTQLLANVWQSTVLEMWKIRPWGLHVRRRSRALQSGRHLNVGWAKDPSLWTVGLLRTFCVEHGWSGSCTGFFFLSFPVSQCIYVPLCLCIQCSDPGPCRHPCPTCVRKHILLIRREKKLLIKGLQNQMSSGVFPTRLFYANF